MKTPSGKKSGVGRVALIIVVVAVIIIIAGVGYYALTLKSSTPPTTTTGPASIASSSTSQTTRGSSSVGNHTFTIDVLAGGSGLDPTYAIEPTIISQIYERLCIIASNGTVLPQLATSWSVSSNGTQWTFNLRQGVKFTDGSIFNASSVNFTLSRQKVYPQGQLTYEPLIVYPIIIANPYTVVINTVRPVPLPLYLASESGTWITSANVFNYAGISLTNNATQNQIDLESWFEAGHSDGTGPYTVVTSLYNAQSSVTLVRNNNYWGGWKANQANTVVFNVVSSSTLAMQELASGQADLFGSPQVNQLPLVTGSGSNAYLLSGTNVAVQMLWYNVNIPPLNNSLVRQALNYAIPYSNISTAVYGNYSTPAVGWVAPGVFGHDPNAQTWSYNLTKAHDLLKQAGYSSGAISPAVSLTVVLYNLYPETATTWELIQPIWSNLGINLNIEIVPGATLISIIKGANPPGIVGLRWSPSCMSAGCQLNDNWGNASFVNFANWYNNTFQATIDQALSVEGTNPAQSQFLFAEAQQMLFQNAPGDVMVNLDTLFVVNNHWHVTAGQVAFEPDEISNTFFVYALQYS
jgi:peptide/nickel transport system substrate-binding protein